MKEYKRRYIVLVLVLRLVLVRATAVVFVGAPGGVPSTFMNDLCSHLLFHTNILCFCVDKWLFSIHTTSLYLCFCNQTS